MPDGEMPSSWDLIHRQIDQDSAAEGMSDMDVWHAWRMGLAAWKVGRTLGDASIHGAPSDETPAQDDFGREPA